MKIIFILIAVLLTQFQCFSQELNTDDLKAIKEELFLQEKCWNEGNLEAYMRVYYNSDSLKFVTKKGITTGWNQIFENYKKSYPDKQSMGNLHFEIVDINTFCYDKAILNGKWVLTTTNVKKEQNKVQGYFTLIWAKISGHWYIIVDHTS